MGGDSRQNVMILFWGCLIKSIIFLFVGGLFCFMGCVFNG